MATLEAMLAPKAFAGKELDPEDMLIEFNKYVKTIKNLFMATGRVTAIDQVKLAILLSVRVTDMGDLFEQVGKVNVVAIDVVEADIARGIEVVDAIAADMCKDYHSVKLETILS